MKKLIQLHIEKLPEGVYLATSDDLQGLVAQGKTLQETLEIARDVTHQLIEAKKQRNQRFFRTYTVENSPSSLSVQQCSKVDKYQSNKNSKPYYTSLTSISC
jgi:predicted RNase H-like HicB family nuclease